MSTATGDRKRTKQKVNIRTYGSIVGTRRMCTLPCLWPFISLTIESTGNPVSCRQPFFIFCFQWCRKVFLRLHWIETKRSNTFDIRGLDVRWPLPAIAFQSSWGWCLPAKLPRQWEVVLVSTRTYAMTFAVASFNNNLIQKQFRWHFPLGDEAKLEAARQLLIKLIHALRTIGRWEKGFWWRNDDLIGQSFLINWKMIKMVW